MLSRIYRSLAVSSVAFCALSAFGVAQSAKVNPVGAGNIIVNSKFGGQIFGFDIDQNGKEGILAESQSLQGGNFLAAVETFDQTTGKILKVLAKTQTMDDFVTLGVVGKSIGLVEREHEVSFLNIQRTFDTSSPLSSNAFTGLWRPPLAKGFLIEAVSRNQGGPTNAIMASGPNLQRILFTTNVAANKFGPQITLTDQNFTFGVPPAMAYDTVTNQAVLAQDFGGVLNVPEIGLVNLTTGATTTFQGLGFGLVNGMAVDSADGIACTTTEIDFSIEFYNIATQSGFVVGMPGATNQLYSGADVEFDPIHKLFLVAQPVSSTSFSGSSIHVFDQNGNFIESINGLNFSNASNIVPAHIALKPSNRTGYVDGPAANVSQLQSFTY
jgi:hypothetical protein